MTIDAAAYQPPVGNQSTYTAAIATPYTSGRKITGTEKLVQRVLLEYFTETGSMPFASTRGSDFLYQLRRGFMSEFDVTTAFSLATVLVTANLQAEELPTDPDNERFASASLTGISISPEYVTLRINVVSRAGKSGLLTYPVTLLTTPQDIAPALD